MLFSLGLCTYTVKRVKCNSGAWQLIQSKIRHRLVVTWPPALHRPDFEDFLRGPGNSVWAVEPVSKREVLVHFVLVILGRFGWDKVSQKNSWQFSLSIYKSYWNWINWSELKRNYSTELLISITVHLQFRDTSTYIIIILSRKKEQGKQNTKSCEL